MDQRINPYETEANGNHYIVAIASSETAKKTYETIVTEQIRKAVDHLDDEDGNFESNV